MIRWHFSCYQNGYCFCLLFVRVFPFSCFDFVEIQNSKVKERMVANQSINSGDCEQGIQCFPSKRIVFTKDASKFLGLFVMFCAKLLFEILINFEFFQTNSRQFHLSVVVCGVIPIKFMRIKRYFIFPIFTKYIR